MVRAPSGALPRFRTFKQKHCPTISLVKTVFYMVVDIFSATIFQSYDLIS